MFSSGDVVFFDGLVRILGKKTINEKKKLIKEFTFSILKKKKNIYRNTVTDKNQKFDKKNQVTRPCVAVLVIFNTFPCSQCSGITRGVQSQGGALFFNPSLIVSLK